MIRFSSVRRWYFGALGGVFRRSFVAIDASFFFLYKKAYSQRLIISTLFQKSALTDQSFRANLPNVALET